MSNIYEDAALIDMVSMHPGGLRLTGRAARLAALSAGMRAADIGCGTGATAAFLTARYGLSVIGLEISDTLVELGLKRYPGLKLIRWDCRTFPFEENSLDAIFFECTLSVLGGVGSVLAQAAQALKTGGTVIISDVCVKGEAGSGASPLYTTGALAEALTAAGFNLVVQEDHTAALRTYAAELWEKLNAGGAAEADAAASDPGCFFPGACGLGNVRLSGLGYTLIIARKI